MALASPPNCGDMIGAKSRATNSVVATVVLEVPAVCVGAMTVPVKVGDARGALRFSAAWVGPEMGFEASAVLSTLPSPTTVLSRVCQDLSPRQYWLVVPEAMGGSNAPEVAIVSHC